MGRLSPAESHAWLGTFDGVAAAGATLPELFALRGDVRKIEERRATTAVGQYL